MALTVGELEVVLRLKDQFTDRVQSATVELEKMGKSVSTQNEKVGAMGGLFQHVASAISLVGFTSFVRGAVESAGAAQNMAERLEVDAHWLQQVGIAAKEGGGGIDDATQSVTFMQKALSGGDSSVVQALTDMGLELDKIQQMQPQQAFMAITEAAKTVPDPIKQTDAAMTLLGRNAGVFLPAIRKGFNDVTSAAQAMSSESIAAADRFDKGVENAFTGAKAVAAETVARLFQVYEQLAGKGPFDVAAIRAQAMEVGQLVGHVADLTEASKERIRKASGELEVIFASAGKDGFQAQRAAAEKLHEMEMQDIEQSVVSNEEKHVRMIEEEKKYSADLYKIKTDEARALRDIQEQSAAAIMARQSDLLQAQLALELSAAALSRGTAESIGAEKAAIVTKYAALEYNAQMAAIDALEQAEALHADNSISTAENKAAALLSIHQKYEQERAILAAQSETQLNAQIEALEAAHVSRMAALGMASTAQPAYSTLTPQQQAATAQHQAAVGPLEAAQNKALTLGDTDKAQKLQTLIDEEGAVFVRAMQEGGAATSDMAAHVTTAASDLADGLNQAKAAAVAVSQTWTVAAGHLSADRFNSAAGGRSTEQIINDQIQNSDMGGIGFSPDLSKYFSPRAKGGPVSAGQTYLTGEMGPELFTPGTSGFITPNGAGAAGGPTVNVSIAGVLMGNDPSARAMLADAVDSAVTSGLSKTRKLGTR